MRSISFASLLLAALLLSGCIDVPPETQDIVDSIPWLDEERAEYVLLDRDSGEEEGRGVLSVTRKDGQFELSLSFKSGDASDESVVLVDATTAKPISIRRELIDPRQRVIITGEYDVDEGIINITETRNDEEPRTIPLRLDEHYYDNDSSLFLWRTIRFEEGYEVSYRTVLANQGSQQILTLRVIGKEEVTVPAGTFQAWRIELEEVDQVVWYADTPERFLVQYDNSVQLLQLVELPGG